MKYVIYIGVAGLILWAAAYLIYRFHQRLRGKRGSSCPHTYCRHRKKP